MSISSCGLPTSPLLTAAAFKPCIICSALTGSNSKPAAAACPPCLLSNGETCDRSLATECPRGARAEPRATPGVHSAQQKVGRPVWSHRLAAAIPNTPKCASLLPTKTTLLCNWPFRSGATPSGVRRFVVVAFQHATTFQCVVGHHQNDSRRHDRSGMQRAEQVMLYAISCRRAAVTRMSERLAGRKNEAAYDVTGSLHFLGLIFQPGGSHTGVHRRGRGSQRFSVKNLSPNELCWSLASATSCSCRAREYICVLVT